MRVSTNPINVLSADDVTNLDVTRSDAHPRDVNHVMSKRVDDEDGRSQWQWFRLPNGDLILGTFPQGSTYFDVVDRAGV